MKRLLIAAAAVLCTASMSQASTLDFNGVTPCTSTDAFVTLTTIGTTACSATVAPTTLSGAIALTRSGIVLGLSAIRVDFAALVGSVSIDMGDFNADPDNIFLEVFDAADVSLGYIDFLRPGPSHDMNTLSLTVAGISYAVFGTNAGDLGYIAADNLTWDTAQVPLPAGGLLLLGALGLLGFGRRRRA